MKYLILSFAILSSVGISRAANAADSNRFLSAGLAGNTCLVSGGKIESCWGRAVNQPQNLSGVTSLSLGQDHACAVANGAVQCWGSDQDGKIDVPANLPAAKSVVVNADTSCAVLVSGDVSCWGSESNIRFQMPALSNVSDLQLSDHGACAVASGKLTCWNLDYFPQVTGQLRAFSILGGQPCIADDLGVRCAAEAEPRIKNVPGKNVVGVYSPRGYQAWSRAELCALFDDKSVICSASDTYSRKDVAPPLQMPTLKNVTSIGVSLNHSCAISDGKVVCWGYSNFGQTILPSELVGAKFTKNDSDEICFVSPTSSGCYKNSWGRELAYVSALKKLKPTNLIPLSPDGVDGYCGLVGKEVYCYSTYKKRPLIFQVPNSLGSVTSLALGDDQRSVCAKDAKGSQSCFSYYGLYGGR